MGNAARIGLAAAAVVAAVVLFLVLRDGDDGGEAAATTTAAATSETGPATETGSDTETGPATPPSPPPSPPPAPERRQLRVNVPAGGPTRIARLDVEQGEDVVLVVRSAVADEVHLHGYDLSADVAPGRVARIRFTADQPGRFEIELEQAHEGIAQLRVTP